MAGAFYVDTGGDPFSVLELLDPRPSLQGPAGGLLTDSRRAQSTAVPASPDNPNRAEHGLPPPLWQPGVGRAISIERGTMAIFPASLAHLVRPHAGRRPRISLSFNVLIEPADAHPPPLPPRPSERLSIARMSETAREVAQDGRVLGQPLAGRSWAEIDASYRQAGALRKVRPPRH